MGWHQDLVNQSLWQWSLYWYGISFFYFFFQIDANTLSVWWEKNTPIPRFFKRLSLVGNPGIILRSCNITMSLFRNETHGREIFAIWGDRVKKARSWQIQRRPSISCLYKTKWSCGLEFKWVDRQGLDTILQKVSPKPVGLFEADVL